MSDLAEYAYCPRAHWYRSHPAEARADPRSLEGGRRGREYHRREARALPSREARDGLVALLGVLVGFLLLAALAWILLL